MTLFVRNNRKQYAFDHGVVCQIYKNRIVHAKRQINVLREQIKSLKKELRKIPLNEIDLVVLRTTRHAYNDCLASLRVHECTVRTCKEIYTKTYNEVYQAYKELKNVTSVSN